MAFNDTNPDELDQMEQDAAQKSAATKKYAALMDTRARGSNAVAPPDDSGQTNIPSDQAESRQPGSPRLAAMFKAPPPENTTDASSSPASSSIISRPDFTKRNQLMDAYETEAQSSGGPLRFMRQMKAQKLAGLQSAIQMEEQRASGDLGTNQKYASFFDPKRLANPIQGRAADGKLKYFQDVFSRDPATGTGKMDYQDTGVEPPMDIRKNVMARGGAAGGVIVTPTGDGGYASETYDNRPEPRALPGGGGKSVPGGYLDAQGGFHKTTPTTPGGRATDHLNAVIQGYNQQLNINGPDAAEAYAKNAIAKGWATDPSLAPGGQPSTSAPPAMARPAAPAGALGKVTPRAAAPKDYGPAAGLKEGQTANGGKYVVHGGRWVDAG